MDKKQLTEQEIRSRFIMPAIQNAGWSTAQIREDYAITIGRIIARGGKAKRDEKSIKRADYILFLKPHIPLAVAEANDNNHSICDGMQQALDYADRMRIPRVYF
jgi:type I restriction enzyme R subunit